MQDIARDDNLVATHERLKKSSFILENKVLRDVFSMINRINIIFMSKLCMIEI